MHATGTDLCILVLKTIQETLQQLISIVDSFSIFSNNPNH